MRRPGVLEATATTELRRCPVCQGEEAFAMPICPDGHGTDCPERMCAACGTAAFAGDWALHSPRSDRAGAA